MKVIIYKAYDLYNLFLVELGWLMNKVMFSNKHSSGGNKKYMQTFVCEDFSKCWDSDLTLTLMKKNKLW
jgi:hypothetical protein